MDPHYALSWNDYEQVLCSALRDFYQNDKLADVTLFAEGKCFLAHRLILSLCSSYFQEVFHFSNCKEVVIVLKDVKADDLSHILDFVYKGTVNVPGCNLKSFMQTAESLRIKGLSKEKSSLLESSLKQQKEDSNDITSPVRQYENEETLTVLPKEENPDEMECPDSELYQEESVNDVHSEYSLLCEKGDNSINTTCELEMSEKDDNLQEDWPNPVDLLNNFPPQLRSDLLMETPPNKKLISNILDAIYEYIKQYTYYLEKYYTQPGRTAHVIWFSKIREKFANSRKRLDRYSIKKMRRRRSLVLF